MPHKLKSYRKDLLIPARQTECRPLARRQYGAWYNQILLNSSIQDSRCSWML